MVTTTDPSAGAVRIVTGAGPIGGPPVKYFSGAGTEVGGTFPFDPTYLGGVFVG